MLTYPNIDPVALAIGPLKVHWYGLMYLSAFVTAWVLARYRASKYHLPWTREDIGDLIFYAAVGVIIGGRVGYMLFYDTPTFLAHPLSLFKIWEGGMSFHGGLIGVAVALVWFAKKTNRLFLVVTDFIAPLVPCGLAFGRIGNFINGELWGRATTMPWGMVFPSGGAVIRHPSQWYEFGLEGIALFIVVWWFAAKPRPAGAVSGVFLMGYAIARIVAEFFRQPDPQLGYLAFGWLTMGQLLSIPMFIVGFVLWQRARARVKPCKII